jgi:hypothetical protein
MCHNNNGDKVHHNNPRVKNGVVNGLMCLHNKIEALQGYTGVWNKSMKCKSSCIPKFFLKFGVAILKRPTHVTFISSVWNVKLAISDKESNIKPWQPMSKIPTWQLELKTKAQK